MTPYIRKYAMIMLAVAIALGAGFVWAGLPVLWAFLAAVNLVTFAAYGYDKRSAIAGNWRVPEAVLHVLAAAGGTPGAFAAQKTFRHKTRDTKFRIVYFMVAGLQVAGLALYLFWRYMPEA